MPNPLALPMVRRSVRNLFSPPATRRYPSHVRAAFPGARGTVEFDLSTCVFCNLCARRCPAVAITCDREHWTFAIDQLRCIACGVCAEVCNKGSLRMTTERRAVRGQLDVPGGGRPGREEWRKPAPAVAAGGAGEG
ncbi:MAG TPA: 4Fe-4S binding protein [Candidatus Limnocylindrales bacterium]